MNSRAGDAAIGMMDGAYFTSRRDILDFFNTLLLMNLTKIEQTASGAVACQLFDYMFPGSVAMKRVNWEAKSDFQFIENYKILQMSFTKNHVQKHVDVDRLVRAKYQDNLEFCQWLKAFYEHKAPIFREDYDPILKRSLGKGGRNLDDIFLPKNKKDCKTKGELASRACKPRIGDRSINLPLRKTAQRKGRSSVGAMSIKTKQHKEAGILVSKTNISSIIAEADVMKKNMDLKKRNAELELTLSGVENERDFYFDKLRGIEVMLQVHDEKGKDSNPQEVIDRIYKVLYATVEENVVVTDDGELIEDEQQENIAPDDDEMLDDSLLMDE